jgi:hypothetical protein
MKNHQSKNHDYPAKALALLLIAGLGALCSCTKSPEPDTTTQDAPPPANSAAPQAPSATASAPAAAPGANSPASPALVSRSLAPIGTFYLLQRVSVTTDDGISSLNPGDKVTLVEDKGATKIVTDGQNKFEVDPTQLTNNLDVVKKMAEQREKAQEDLQAQRAAALANMPAAAPADAAAASSGESQADVEKKNNLQNQMTALVQQENNLLAQIAYAQQQLDAQGHAAMTGRVSSAQSSTVSYGQINAIQAQLDQLKQQQQQLQWQLDAAK